MKAYYARPISLYSTEQEKRDMQLIRKFGLEPEDVNKVALQEAYEKQGMEVFKSLVESTGALFFRSFLDGSIGAGVAKEIGWAQAIGLPVVELPRLIKQRALSVDDTRAYLAELGQR